MSTENPPSTSVDESAQPGCLRFRRRHRQRHARRLVPRLHRPAPRRRHGRAAGRPWPGRALHRVLVAAAGDLHQQPQHRQPARSGVGHLGAGHGAGSRAPARRDRPVGRSDRRHVSRLHGRGHRPQRPELARRCAHRAGGRRVGRLGDRAARRQARHPVVRGHVGILPRPAGRHPEADRPGRHHPRARRRAAGDHDQVHAGRGGLDRGDRAAGDLRRAAVLAPAAAGGKEPAPPARRRCSPSSSAACASSCSG